MKKPSKLLIGLALAAAGVFGAGSAMAWGHHGPRVSIGFGFGPYWGGPWGPGYWGAPYYPYYASPAYYPVPVVVALLERIAGSLRFARAGESTAREADAGANASTRAAAEEATGCRADRGTHGRARYRAPVLRIRYRGAADRLRRVLAALVVIKAELIEALSGARQNHHARAGRRRRCAAGEKRCRAESENRAFHHCPGGDGGTAFQPLAHSLTYG